MQSRISTDNCAEVESGTVRFEAFSRRGIEAHGLVSAKQHSTLHTHNKCRPAATEQRTRIRFGQPIANTVHSRNLLIYYRLLKMAESWNCDTVHVVVLTITTNAALEPTKYTTICICLFLHTKQLNNWILEHWLLTNNSALLSTDDGSYRRGCGSAIHCKRFPFTRSLPDKRFTSWT